MLGFTLYFKGRANIMADGLDVMCETNREVKDNAKVYGFFDLSN